MIYRDYTPENKHVFNVISWHYPRGRVSYYRWYIIPWFHHYYYHDGSPGTTTIIIMLIVYDDRLGDINHDTKRYRLGKCFAIEDFTKWAQKMKAVEGANKQPYSHPLRSHRVEPFMLSCQCLFHGVWRFKIYQCQKVPSSAKWRAPW